MNTDLPTLDAANKSATGREIHGQRGGVFAREEEKNVLEVLSGHEQE